MRLKVATQRTARFMSPREHTMHIGIQNGGILIMWFVYGFVFAFTIPLLLFGVYKPNDLYFEHYLKYRLHFELTIPLRTISGKKGLEHEKKIKYIKETKDFND